MMVTQVSDPLGNTITSVPDYRLLVPKQLTDPNGNRSAAAFDELGRILRAALMGKEGGTDGDTLEDPTQEFEYVTDEWSEHQRPNYTHTKARKQHGGTAQWQESYVYSDGSGRVAMTKLQAEPGDAPDLDEETGNAIVEGGELQLSNANPRWVGSGRTILNNKGAPVKQYEPYFSRTHAFETDENLVQWGVTPIIHYDPIGRPVRVDLPNGSYRRTEYGVWKATSYDENDTVGEVGNLWSADRSGRDPSDPEFKAYDQALAHAATPSRSYADTMGRPFLAIAHNINDEDEAEFICTRTELDIEGQPKTVTDPLGRTCQTHAFSIGGQLLLETNIDKGSRRMLLTVLGEPLRKWDDRDQRFRVQYDDLRRPTHLYLQVGGDDEALLERRYYGDNAGITDPEDDNLRGQLVALYDGAGLVKAGPFDFKGNPLSSSRQLVAAHDETPDWIDLAEVTGAAASEVEVESLLADETFSESREYDALNRLVSATAPDGSIFTPTYNEASLLEAVEVAVRGGAARTFVRNIDYDAKGQRTRIEYSDEDPGDAMADAPTFLTEYFYDPLTFRLSRLITTRVSDSRALQDLGYTLDPVGNIVRIVDDAYQPIFFNNAVVLPENGYLYDAVYRLINANGREHASIGDAQVDDADTAIVTLPHANMSDAVRNYEETFSYDKIGNILSMFHDAEGSPHATWTRTYSYTSGTNRLASHSAPGGSVSFSYDEHGSMTVMPHLSTIENNPYDQMQMASNGSQDTYFQYGADGQRVRKVFDTRANLLKERIYLGSFEIYREIVSSAIEFERQTLHVMDGIKRIATVETRTIEDGDPVGSPTSLIRYQLGNHLGSAMLEVDEDGLVQSYEEYHPYGTSAYRAAASGLEVAKRYRFNGKERDEETGLYYSGARYYAAWLARWTSADPLGIGADGPGVYNYTRGSPVTLTDPNGTQTPPSTTELDEGVTGSGSGPDNAAEEEAREQADFEAWAERQERNVRNIIQYEEANAGQSIFTKVQTESNYGKGYGWVLNGDLLRAQGRDEMSIIQLEQDIGTYGLYPAAMLPPSPWVGQAEPGTPLAGIGTQEQAGATTEAEKARLAAWRADMAFTFMFGFGQGIASFKALNDSFEPYRPTTTITNESGGSMGGGGGGGGAAPPPGLDPSNVVVERDPFSVRATVPGDSRAFARVETDFGTLKVTDVYRGATPKGGGRVLLAEALREGGVASGSNIVLHNVINQPSLDAYAAGAAPESTVVGQLATAALQRLGLSPGAMRWEVSRGKLTIVFTVE